MKFNIALTVSGTILLFIAGSLCQLDVCGQTPLNTRIIGGEDAQAGAWPWQVSIHVEDYYGYGSYHSCGGSLINKDWVLSAAHCFQTYEASTIVMYFGRRSQSGPNPNETFRRVKQIINHPNYDSSKFDFDIALVQLSSSVDFTNYVRPVCLAAAGSVFAGGTETWVTGFGTLQTGGTPADTLQEVMIPIVNHIDCNKAYSGFITSNMICAGLLNVGGKSSCQGDSGGPAVNTNGSLWIQSGIVSFGSTQCDHAKYPSVFARVSQFQDWIKSFTGNNPPGFVQFPSNGLSTSVSPLISSVSPIVSSVSPIVSSVSPIVSSVSPIVSSVSPIVSSVSPIVSSVSPIVSSVSPIVSSVSPIVSSVSPIVSSVSPIVSSVSPIVSSVSPIVSSVSPIVSSVSPIVSSVSPIVSSVSPIVSSVSPIVSSVSPIVSSLSPLLLSISLTFSIIPVTISTICHSS